jgi:hypothetical protein
VTFKFPGWLLNKIELLTNDEARRKARHPASMWDFLAYSDRCRIIVTPPETTSFLSD